MIIIKFKTFSYPYKGQHQNLQRSVYLYSTHNTCTILDKENFLFHRLPCLWINLMQELNNLTFFNYRVDVQNSLIPSRKNSLILHKRHVLNQYREILQRQKWREKQTEGINIYIVQQFKDLQLRNKLSNGWNWIRWDQDKDIKTMLNRSANV